MIKDIHYYMKFFRDYVIKIKRKTGKKNNKNKLQNMLNI